MTTSLWRKLRSLIVEGAEHDVTKEMAAGYTFESVTPHYAALFEKTAGSGIVSA